jgi:hypothetical protein
MSYFSDGLLKVIFKILFLKFFYIHVSLKKINQQKNFSMVFLKIFSFYFKLKYFLKVVKNLKMSCYLLIISNLVLKLLISIYFVWIFFSISLLKI